MSDRRVVKFKNRLATNTSDKRIAEAYSAGSGFDVDLITADNKVVSAHRFVLAMFSKHLAQTLNDCGFDGKIVVPLEIPYAIVQKVVELFYFREVTVSPLMEQNMMKALKSLKVSLVYPDNEQPPPRNANRHSMPAVPFLVPQQRPVVAAAASKGPKRENDEMLADYSPAKRQRAQSVFVERSPRLQNGLPINVQRAPISGGTQNNPQAKPVNGNLPAGMTVSKVAKPVVGTAGQTNVPLPPGLTLSKVAKPVNDGQMNVTLPPGLSLTKVAKPGALNGARINSPKPVLKSTPPTLPKGISIQKTTVAGAKTTPVSQIPGKLQTLSVVQVKPTTHAAEQSTSHDGPNGVHFNDPQTMAVTIQPMPKSIVQPTVESNQPANVSSIPSTGNFDTQPIATSGAQLTAESVVPQAPGLENPTADSIVQQTPILDHSTMDDLSVLATPCSSGFLTPDSTIQQTTVSDVQLTDDSIDQPPEIDAKFIQIGDKSRPSDFVGESDEEDDHQSEQIKTMIDAISTTLEAETTAPANQPVDDTQTEEERNDDAMDESELKIDQPNMNFDDMDIEI